MLKFPECKQLNEIVVLDPVTTEDLIPIESNDGMTAWKFKFNDKVIWFPMASVDTVLPYATIFKMLSESLIKDYSTNYDVYGETIGIVSKVLDMTSNVSYTEDNEVIDKNKESISMENKDYVTDTTKDVGIFINDSLCNILDDKGYKYVYTFVMGDTMNVLFYMFASQMHFSKKDTNYVVDNIVRCGEYALFRYIRVNDNVISGEI